LNAAARIFLMKLIVGLGNYPEKYARTRHNFGFLAVDFLAQKLGFNHWEHTKKLFGRVAGGHLGSEKVLFLRPETYMNLSGKSVAAAANFYKIPPENVIVLFDDVDLSFGEIRFREKGGSGGHNGSKSIISSLGTEEFIRLKFGISNQYRENIATDAFVLQKFTPEEWKKIPEILDLGVQKLQPLQRLNPQCLASSCFWINNQIY